MDASGRTPIQVACDNVITALREHARCIEQISATFGRIRALLLEHYGDVVAIRDCASQLHNVGVDLRRKLHFQELAKQCLELERNLTHALEGGRK